MNPNPGPEPDPTSEWRLAGAERERVLFVGRFDRHKGGDLVVDAFAKLVERRPGALLTIAGPDDGVVDAAGRRWMFAEYLETRLSAEHRHAVTMLGRVPQSRLAELRFRASVVISASRYENFALALLEAMSQGCPIVCSDGGGSPEMIEDGHSGVVFPSGDAGALAERIEALLAYPERAAELGAQALRNYRQRYLALPVARTTADFYAEVIAKRQHVHPVRQFMRL